MKYWRIAVGSSLLILVGQVHAHGNERQDRGHLLSASASVTWRSDSAVEEGGYWRIPGIQMSGEAWPASRDFTLDDAQLFGRYQINDSTTANAKLSTHAGGEGHEHSGVELDHLYLRHEIPLGSMMFSGYVGRMSGGFSPSAYWHSSLSRFSEASLLTDAFWGRYFDDEGLRLELALPSGLKLGAEYWAGKAFPATDGKSGGSYDVYLSHKLVADDWRVATGVWWFNADALRRADMRYSDGHNHGDPLNPLPADVRYTGNTQTGGLWLDSQLTMSAGIVLSVAAEWARSQLSGDILDATRQAALDADYDAWHITPAVEMGQHALALRYEGLALSNHLSGPAARQLATDAGLHITDDEPQRLSAQWRYQWTPALAWRLEYVLDDSLDNARKRFAVGLVWQQKLWQQLP